MSQRSDFLSDLERRARHYGITSPSHLLGLRGLFSAAWDAGYSEGAREHAELVKRLNDAIAKEEA
jgi:hypothetical protein